MMMTEKEFFGWIQKTWKECQNKAWSEKMNYDTRHGGPFDRGGADYYYGRPFDPHYYVGDTYSSERVELANMTAQQIVEYTAGYNAGGAQKDWG